eukprot:Polyplicarium_translucidae@DN3273_c0_g1_i7.p1
MLSEGTVSRRVQNFIEAFMVVVKSNYKDYPTRETELDLLHEEDCVTHQLDLVSEDIKGEEMLNIFKALPPAQFEEEELRWKQISAEILEGDESGSEDDADVDAGDEEDEERLDIVRPDGQVAILDYTQQDLINLRRTVYLAIQSSATFEECVHKLLKMNIKEGLENEVIQMLLDCCSMERTYSKFYALQAERLSRLNPAYKACCEAAFETQYNTVYRLETPKIRHTAMFFAHLLATEAISWGVLSNIVLTEETTTSAARIFVKILFQEMAEHLGLAKLTAKLRDPEREEFFVGIFPMGRLRLRTGRWISQLSGNRS